MMRPVSCESPRCPTCNSRMACFPDNSWRCPKCAPQAQEEAKSRITGHATECKCGHIMADHSHAKGRCNFFSCGCRGFEPRAAQEETRGAPAPTLEKIRAMASEVRAGLEAGQWKDRDALIGVLSGIVVQAENLAQPPAPASPAGRKWKLTTYFSTRNLQVMQGPAFAECEEVWVQEVAEPEAGAPGTQKLPNLEQLSPAEHRDILRQAGTQRPSTIEAAAMLAEAIRRAGTQEGGSHG